MHTKSDEVVWTAAAKGDARSKAGDGAAPERRSRSSAKEWKLSPIDQASIDKWDDYTEAKQATFFYTDTADPPWTTIRSDDKKRARLACMRHFLSSLPYPDKDESVVEEPDPLLVGRGRNALGDAAGRSFLP